MRTVTTKRKYSDCQNLPDQQSKKPRVETAIKPTVTLTQKSTSNNKDYETLLDVTKLNSRFCTNQMMKAAEYTKIHNIEKNTKSQVMTDLFFIARLSNMIEKLRDLLCDDNVTLSMVSEICFDIVTHINDECEKLYDAIYLIENKKTPRKNKEEAYKKLFIDGFQDSSKDRKLERAKNNLIILKDIQEMYIPHILNDSTKFLLLIQIALIWNKKEIALDLIREINIALNENSLHYEENMGILCESLNKYKEHHPVDYNEDKELIQHHDLIREASHKKPQFFRSISYHNLNNFFF